MPEATPSFATFWAGKHLSAFEAACLSSFATRGYQTIVYSYDVIENIPARVTLLDASEIAPMTALDRFLCDGQPNLSHFSDYFRYLLFMKTEHTWIDADMLMLRAIDRPLGRTVLARERADSICGAILRLDNTDTRLSRLISETEAVMDRNLLWGETGPRLLTKVFGRDAVFRNAYAPELFFPISHDDFWKVFLPEYSDECDVLCKNAFTVHLWNNIVDRLGVWKALAPPSGSFLARHFEADGSLCFFRDAYPEKVMSQMVENWRLRKNGADLGIANLSRQLVPSVFRTARHYLGDARLPSLGSSQVKVITPR